MRKHVLSDCVSLTIFWTKLKSFENWILFASGVKKRKKKKWLSGSKEKCLEAIFERLIRGLTHQIALRKQHSDELSAN